MSDAEMGSRRPPTPDAISLEIEEAGRIVMDRLTPAFDAQQRASGDAKQNCRLARHEARRLKGSSSRALTRVSDPDIERVFSKVR